MFDISQKKMCEHVKCVAEFHVSQKIFFQHVITYCNPEYNNNNNNNNRKEETLTELEQK